MGKAEAKAKAKETGGRKMAFDDFRKMHVWQLTFKLVVKVYKVTKDFPAEEKFGLVSDMRRSVNSILYNIAEGLADMNQGTLES